MWRDIFDFNNGAGSYSPLRAVVVTGAIILGAEFLLMTLVEGVFASLFGYRSSHFLWGVLDSIALTLLASTVLYFLVLRPMQKQQKQLALQKETLDVLAVAFSSGSGIMITDLAGNILKVNPAFTRVTGYAAEEVVGKTPRILHSGRQEETFYQRMWQSLQAEGAWQGEIWNCRKNGEVYPQWLDITAVRGEAGPRYYVGIFSDISERKRAEQALVESRKKFHMLFDAISDAIFITSADGKFLQVNRSACDRLGYTQDELLQLGPMQIDSPEYAAKVPERIKTLFEHGSLTFESAHVRKDGTIIPVEISNRIIEYEGRHAILGVARDISERKQAERVLEETMRKLEEKEFAKTRFLAAAGHDMRQPIAAASLLVETLKATSLSMRQQDLIERLDRAMGVFSAMLARLLDISKFDAGLIKPEHISCNLKDLLLWVDQSFAPEARNKNLRLRLFFPASHSLIVRTDLGLVQSVLMNLVSNAVKFTEHGSILLSARLRGRNVLVQVWDTGVGISEADLPHVFEEFYQAGNPQRNREAGLGLGLSICQRAMALLGSEITCRSRLGHGTVFSFVLPLDTETRPSESPPAASLAQPATGEMLFRERTVALLEDDALVAQAMCSLFESMGCKVRHFVSAEDALSSAEAASADFYIVDYMLGGERNGIDFLNQLRKMSGKPVNAVLVSGDTSSGFIRKAEMFDWPVLHKPLDLRKLIAALDNFQAG